MALPVSFVLHVTSSEDTFHGGLGSPRYSDDVAIGVSCSWERTIDVAGSWPGQDVRGQNSEGTRGKRYTYGIE